MTIKVSVIVATYNPGSNIDDLIRSLLAQSMPADEFEVIFADDDSTDGTRAGLEALAAEYRHFRVLHNTPNSGWPGRPRNLGIDAARGEFLYFIDNDDWIGDEAIERLYRYAVEQSSDIVFGRIVGHNRRLPRDVFRRNVVDAGLNDGLLTLLTPHKLFRAAMLMEHGIRFPEGRVRLEDHLFVMKAYFAAKRISILADYPCYHWVNRGDNASFDQPDPAVYFDSMRAVLEVVASHTEPGRGRDKLLAHWYGGKSLSRLESRAMLEYDDDYRQRLFAAVRQLMLDWFPPSVDEFLPARRRVASELLRSEDLEAMIRFAAWQSGIRSAAVLYSLEWTDNRLQLEYGGALLDAEGRPVRVRREGPMILLDLPAGLALGEFAPAVLDVTEAFKRTRTALLLRDRATSVVEFAESKTVTPPAFDDSGVADLRVRSRAVVDPAALAHLRVVDPLVRFLGAGWGLEVRPPVPDDMNLEPLVRRFGERRLVPYRTTTFSNLSLAWRKVPATTSPRLLAPLRRRLSSARPAVGRAMRRIRPHPEQ